MTQQNVRKLVGMRQVSRWLAGLVMIVGANACTRANPDYCDQDTDCMNGEVCNLDINRCIPDPAGSDCSSNDECPAERPICAEDAACRSCLADAECASSVCRTDGTCELSERILYARPNGIASGECTAADPCSLSHAQSLLTSERGTIHLADGTYPLTSSFVIYDAKQVTIVGSRNARMERTSPGFSFEIMGIGTTATLRGFTLTRGLTCSNAALDMSRMALHSGNEPRPWISSVGCTLNVSESELSDGLDKAIVVSGGSASVTGTKIERTAGDALEISNATATIKTSTITESTGIGVTAQGGALIVQRSSISANRMGGIRSTQGTFEIVNNFVFQNGNAANSTFGGMHLDSNAAQSRVQHNTVTRNDCDVNVEPPFSGGVYCNLPFPSNACGNVIANNFRGNTTYQNAQTGGNCFFGCSLVKPDTIEIGCAPGSNECHLSGNGGLALDAGTDLGVMEDFDGEPRSDGKPDFGADEFHP